MKKIIILTSLILLSGCGTPPQHSGTISEDKMNELVMYAVSLAETPYHYGGKDPENGFDCSGYVDHVFQHALGITLPRTSHELSHAGMPINYKQLRPGDLVFYNTQHSAFSHVGIYVGENKFVHAPKSGSRIRVEIMNEKYWQKRYNGARRIEGSL